MSKETKLFTLYSLLKETPTGVSQADISAKMGLKPNSVPVYLWWLSKSHGVPVNKVKGPTGIRLYSTPGVDNPTFQKRKNASQKVAKKTTKKIAAPVQKTEEVA